MYAWLFQRLPGPLWTKIAICVALVGVTLAALLWYVFPWLEGQLNLSEVTLDA